ncbi:MAG: PIN domain-containing protein [Thiotrichales bacterium]
MLLIIDANVLIDYLKSDPAILAFAARHLGQIYIPRAVLEEVEQLTETYCQQFGLTLVDESLEILIAAAELRGSLSFADRVCLLLARERGWTCVTNDKPLHKACRADGIGVIWGLRLMLELTRANQLEPAAAIEVATAIHRLNPRHITPAIVEEFRQKITSR